MARLKSCPSQPIRALPNPFVSFRNPVVAWGALPVEKEFQETIPIYFLKRGGGNNSATTRPTINIQIKLLLSSELCTAMLCNGGNNSVAKIRVQHTVPSRPAAVPNLMVTATTTTKKTIGNMDFTELCRKEKVRPKASTTQSPAPSSALPISLRHIPNQR